MERIDQVFDIVARVIISGLIAVGAVRILKTRKESISLVWKCRNGE